MVELTGKGTSKDAVRKTLTFILTPIQAQTHGCVFLFLFFVFFFFFKQASTARENELMTNELRTSMEARKQLITNRIRGMKTSKHSAFLWLFPLICNSYYNFLPSETRGSDTLLRFR